MKALVLAGGLGTRLRPLTDTRPKPLLPIANRPHIEHVFELLLLHGIDEVVLLTSYLSDAFADAIAAGEVAGLSVAVAHEPEPLGTGGGIANAADLIGDDTFLVLNGDILSGADLAAVIERHRAESAEVTIMLTPVEDPSAYGVVPTNSEGRVTAFVEKPDPGTASSNLINAGVYVFDPSVLGDIPRGRPVSAERELFPGLVERGATVIGHASDAYWIDVGTPATYLQANMDALTGVFITSAVPAPAPGLVLPGEGAEVAPSAVLLSVCLGAEAEVRAGATVSNSVVMEGAVIEQGATVEGSIIGARAVVGAGGLVRDRVVADSDRIGA